MLKNIVIFIAFLLIVGCSTIEEPRQKSKTIHVFLEEFNNESQATITIVNGDLKLQVKEGVDVKDLKKVLDEISSKETLPLEVERYVDGNYVLGEVQVSKTVEEYPYAVQKALNSRGFRSEVK